MNPSADPATLLTFVTTNEDGSYKINIYGTPAGLRNLAAQLLKQADVDQQPMTYLRDYDTDHTHIKPTYATAILAPSSDELQLGRLDTRTGELAYWAQKRIKAAAWKKNRVTTLMKPLPQNEGSHRRPVCRQACQTSSWSSKGS